MDLLALADNSMGKNCTASDPTDPANGQKDVYVQLALSLALGVSAFVAFCVSVTNTFDYYP